MNVLYKELNRGDGLCVNFDELNNLCRIYEDRPLICRVDQMHEVLFRDMEKHEYIVANVMYCQQAQLAAGIPNENRINFSKLTEGI